MIPGTHMYSTWHPLPKAPTTVQKQKEIAVVYNQNLSEFFNALLPQERVFIYYLFRASLPGNLVATDQSHRDAPKIKTLLEHLILNKDALHAQKMAFDVHQFLKEIGVYLTYFWTTHSQYFGEFADQKRTPTRLGLSLLTKNNLIAALEQTGYEQASDTVQELLDSIFDRTVESTLTVPNSIDKSAVNFYAPDFTNKDFEAIDPKGQNTLNAYFYVDETDGERVPKYAKYAVDGKYGDELTVMVYWLQKAHKHAKKYPEQFDDYFIKSLSYLIKYLQTGDEELFKKHSIEWLKSKSKLDYVFGFIETYNDPKSYRALFQSDVTIKSLDIDKLNQILPELEDRLPLPEHFKRDNLHGAGSMPNASINVKAFTAGSLGPLNNTLAFALPNYSEIRAQHGTKQIIYHVDKNIGELLNPELYNRLFNNTEYYKWFQKHDPDYQLMRDIFMLEVILHETLGHGSGRLCKHTFVDGDPMTIEGKKYKAGDTIAVTGANLPQLLAGYSAPFEELRAEIIALLSSIICFDDFARLGMLKDWPKKVSKEKIIELSIVSMIRTALRRLIKQADNAAEVAGAHAQANMTIMNYMIEHGAIALEQEPITTPSGFHTVLDVRILSLERAIAVITELANLVQKIKSTGDGVKVRWLIETYGKPIRAEYMKIMKANMKAVAGEVKFTAMLYPHYDPIKNEEDEIIDINATWPENLESQYLTFRNLSLKTD